MKLNILKTMSYLGLVLALFPCLFMFAGAMSVEMIKHVMMVGTILWFACSVFWIKKDHVSL